tara:strand:- start:971 stop:2095 length:1125 start_codon:yes stop_codon:yes gene_type:complete
MNWLFSISNQVISGLLVVAIPTITLFVWQLIWIRRVKVLEPHGERLNEKFHNYFNSVIDTAKDEILVTGEGFDYESEEGTSIANRYHEAIKRALRRGVHVTRIQSAYPLSIKWANRLSVLVQEYPNNFHLYILDKSKVQDNTNVCVIDPDRRQCVVEMMLSTDSQIGEISSRLAGTGLFIYGRRSLAQAMRSNIRVLKCASIARKIENLEQIEAILSESDETIMYFAFGSNMSKAIMSQRCPSAKLVGIRKIEGYELEFNRIGDYREGGVASIRTAIDRSTHVYGVIWEISINDMKILDTHEVQSSYQRIKVTAIGDSGDEAIECQAYVALPQPGPIRPDREYLEIIISAAVSMKLPERYIRSLESFRNINNTV